MAVEVDTEQSVSSDSAAGLLADQADLSARPSPWRVTLPGLLAALLIIVYASLLLAYLYPEDLRNQSRWYLSISWAAFMMRTFQFQLGLGLVPAALACLAQKRWPVLAATLPLMLFTLGPAIWQYFPRATAPPSDESFTLMSVNLRAGNTLTEPIMAEIAAAKPDILLLQEYSPPWHEVIEPALSPDYPYITLNEGAEEFGTAVYSRLPFVEPQDTPLKSASLELGQWARPNLRVKVRVGGREITIYNVHLVPPRDLYFYAEARWQLADLLDFLARQEGHVIVAGDFNFTSSSAPADAIRQAGLREVHHLAGRGRGSTWPVISFLRNFPGLRIDQIYLSPGLTCTRSATGQGQGSDHRPVVAHLGFSK